jgi:hypothetical protein
LVGKSVELGWVESLVSSGSISSSIGESSNLSSGWVDVVFLEPLGDSRSEFRDLTITVFVNQFEDMVGIFIGDTFISSFDLDGGGGGDEGEEGEFHFELFVFYLLL